MRAMSGYRLIYNRRIDDTRKELQIVDTHSRIKDDRIKLSQNLGRMKQVDSLNDSQTTNPEAVGTKEAHAKD
jgi:hypothetical protein